MKKIAIVNMLIAFVLVLGSCSTSNDVVSNRLISKRKFNKGFHINKKSNFKGTNGSQEQEVLAFETEKEKESKSEKNADSQKKIVSPKTVVTKEQVKSSVAEVSKDLNNSGSEKKGAKDNVASNDERAISEVKTTENSTQKEDSNSKKKPDSKQSKKQDSSGSGWSDSMFILAVICAILIPPLGVGIYTNIDWMKVLICFLLTFLFFLPGMIYALLVVFDVI